MSQPFMAEIKIMSCSFAPKGWAECNGQLLPINQNQALFSLLGTTYGGDGRVTFALPDLRSRMPLMEGNGFVLGQKGGQEAHTLILSELPMHTHGLRASTGTADLPLPKDNVYADSGKNGFGGGSPTGAMDPTSVTSTGGSQPHPNMSPYLVLNFCIALQGIFPSQT